MSAIAAAANQEEFRPDEASKGLDGGKRDRPVLTRQLSRMEAGRQSPPPSGSNPELKQTYIILTCVLALVALMAFIFFTLPPLSTVESRDNKFIWHPTKAEHFRRDKDLLLAYRTLHKWRLLLGMSMLYILLQTFCIPGSGTTMNVLAGCLFKDVIPHGEYLVALPYALGCATAGAVLCYLLSLALLKDFVSRNFPTRVASLRQMMMGSDNLFFLVLSMRVSPMIPAWFLNISLPLVPIPVWQFAGATLIGALPASLLAVETGAALSRLEAGEDLLKPSARQLFLLFLLALVAAVPALSRRLSVKLMDLDAPDAALKVSR